MLLKVVVLRSVEHISVVDLVLVSVVMMVSQCPVLGCRRWMKVIRNRKVLLVIVVVSGYAWVFW